MSLPILQTKFFIPRSRANLVRRTALLARLSPSDLPPLTLLSAPAGFGKTTLVCEWIAQSGQRAAWLSLDEDDNDPTRFLSYVIAALQTVQPTIGVSAQSLLSAPQPPPPKTILTLLLNELGTLTTPLTLALDDYHLLLTPAIHEALAFFVDHLPPLFHLVITSRIDPPLPLARWRVRNQLAELRAADLRFRPEEAAAFLNELMGLRLTTAEIITLAARTEGWIAGLQLAALSLQGRNDTTGFIQAFTGSHVYIIDYLAEEVLQRLPADTQSFLLQTAILQRLCGALCDAITGQTGSQLLLEKLQQSNLFIIPLDDERRWFRYHHLFADVLHARLRQVAPDQIQDLHRRAGAWYEQNGQMAEAVQHALAARDFAYAAALIERIGLNVFVLGPNYHTISQWLTTMPVEFVRQRPRLCIMQAWLQFHQRQLAAALVCLEEAEQALAQPSSNDTLETRNLYGEILATRSLITLYAIPFDAAQVHAWLQAALAALQPDNTPYRGMAFDALGTIAMHQGDVLTAENAYAEAARLGRAGGHTYVVLAATSHQTKMQQARGALGVAITTCQQFIDWVSNAETEASPPMAVLYTTLADLLRERNDLAAAWRWGVKAVERCIHSNNTPLIISSHLTLLRIKQAQGDWAEASALLQQVRQRMEQQPIPWFLNLLPAVAAQLHLAQGDLAVALSWSPPADWETKLLYPLIGTSSFSYAYEYGAMTQAKIRLAQGRATADQHLLRALVAQMEQQRLTAQTTKVCWLEIKADALQALAHHALGDRAAAMTNLKRALLLGQPEGFVRVFVDEGAPMRQLIYELRATLYDQELVHHADRLLAAFGEVEAPSAAAPATVMQQDQSPLHEIQNLIEPLTDRQREILLLVTNGFSNSEIADKLIVTVGTVKKHLNNIFGKLGVSSRTQAIARVRELDLLSH